MSPIDYNTSAIQVSSLHRNTPVFLTLHKKAVTRIIGLGTAARGKAIETGTLTSLRAAIYAVGRNVIEYVFFALHVTLFCKDDSEQNKYVLAV